jgi:hypothetical protein
LERREDLSAEGQIVAALGLRPHERVLFITELSASSFAVKLPIDLHAITVHSPIPGARFFTQSLETGDSSAAQALPGEDPDFDIRLIEPTSRFRSSVPCLPVPLSTLHVPPCVGPRMTRGQDGLLFLSCRTLSFPIPCRFIPAHSVFIGGLDSFPLLTIAPA